MDKITAWLDTLLGSGPGKSGVEVGSDEIKVRMGLYHLEIPRGAARSARRSRETLRGTSGLHLRPPGQLLMDGFIAAIENHRNP